MPEFPTHIPPCRVCSMRFDDSLELLVHQKTCHTAEEISEARRRVLYKGLRLVEPPDDTGQDEG